MRYNKKKIYKSYCLTKKSARWIIKYCLECFSRKQNLKKKLIHCSSDFAVSHFCMSLISYYSIKLEWFFFSIKVYLLDIFVFGTTFTHDNKHQRISNSTTQTPIKQDFYFFFRYADIRINFKSCIFSICRFLLSQSLFFFQNYWIDYIVHVAKMWLMGGTIFMFYSKCLINWMIIWNSSRSCVWDTVFRWSSRYMPLLLNEWCDLWQALFLNESVPQQNKAKNVLLQ